MVRLGALCFHSFLDCFFALGSNVKGSGYSFLIWPLTMSGDSRVKRDSAGTELQSLKVTGSYQVLLGSLLNGLQGKASLLGGHTAPERPG